MFENKTKLMEDLRYKFPDSFQVTRDYLKKSADGITAVYRTNVPHILEIDVSCDELLENVTKVSTLYSEDFSEAANGEKKEEWDAVPLEDYCSSYESVMETIRSDLNRIGTGNKIVLTKEGRAYIAMSDPDVANIVVDSLKEKVRGLDLTGLSNIEDVKKALDVLDSIKKNGITEEDISDAGFSYKSVGGVVKTYVLSGTDTSKDFTSDGELQQFLITDMMANFAKYCSDAAEKPYNEKIYQILGGMVEFYRLVGSEKDYHEYCKMRGWTISEEEKKAKITFD